MYVELQIFEDFFRGFFNPLSLFNFYFNSIMSSECAWYDFSYFKFAKVCFCKVYFKLVSFMAFFLVNGIALEKNVHLALFAWRGL